MTSRAVCAFTLIVVAGCHNQPAPPQIPEGDQNHARMEPTTPEVPAPVVEPSPAAEPEPEPTEPTGPSNDLECWNGVFHGVGLELTPDGADKPLKIHWVVPGTPAARAGLKKGDLVLKIAGKSTIDMNIHEVTQLTRGAIGSPVSLRIKRKGSKPETVTLERESVDLKPFKRRGRCKMVG